MDGLNIPAHAVSRRTKMLRIEPKVVAGLLAEPLEGSRIELMNRLPRTAHVVDAGYDVALKCFVLLIADASFDEVRPGDLPPELKVDAKVVYAEQNRP
jgi:hypothetical protein